MIKNNFKFITSLSILLMLPFFITACTVGSKKVTTDYPLPQNVTSLMDLGNSQINFQTNLSIKDTLAFYRNEFVKKGLIERAILTNVNDTTFSIVFDKQDNEKSTIVQAVTIKDKTNVNIRQEVVQK